MDMNKYLFGAKFFFRFKSGLPPVPRDVTIMPTLRCNLRCSMCTWTHEPEHKELSFEEIIKILEDLKELGVRVVRYTGGGEPLVFPRFIDLMKTTKEMGFFGHLTTNGLLLTEDRTKEIVKMGWDRIVVSVDGWDADSYGRIRKNGGFEKLKQNILYLNKFKETQNTSKPVLELATVVMSENYRFLDKMVDVCKEWNVQEISFNPIIDYGLSDIDKELFLRDELLEQVVQSLYLINKKAEQAEVATNIPAILRNGLESIRRKITVKACYQPWLSALIFPSGKVAPCCYLHDCEIGDIREESFQQIWRGEKYTKLREDFQRGKFLSGCTLCDPSIVAMQEKIHEVLSHPVKASAKIRDIMQKVVSFK
ncbi:MAG: radical SAM/SPASM domain-containing protein [bacterium]